MMSSDDKTIDYMYSGGRSRKWMYSNNSRRNRKWTPLVVRKKAILDASDIIALLPNPKVKVYMFQKNKDIKEI